MRGLLVAFVLAALCSCCGRGQVEVDAPAHAVVAHAPQTLGVDDQTNLFAVWEEPLAYTTDNGRMTQLTVRMDKSPTVSVTVRVKTPTNVAIADPPSFVLTTVTAQNGQKVNITGVQNNFLDADEFIPLDIVIEASDQSSQNAEQNFGTLFGYHLDHNADSHSFAVSRPVSKLFRGGSPSGLLVRCPRGSGATQLEILSSSPQDLTVSPSSITCPGGNVNYDDRIRRVTLTALENSFARLGKQEYTVQVRALGGNGKEVAVSVYDGAIPGFNVETTRSWATNGASSTHMRFSVNSRPTHEVVGAISTSDPDLLRLVSPSRFVIPKSAWDVVCSATFTIPSRPASESLTSVSTIAPATVTYRLQSDDPNYNNLEQTVPIEARILPQPRIIGMNPMSSPTSGGSVITMETENASPLSAVYVEQTYMKNVTYVPVVGQGSQAILTFITPQLNAVGYVAIKVFNPDDGFTQSSQFYYTDTCPGDGQFAFEEGGECEPCPEGAQCPGGTRVWPQAGYWSVSEDSFEVIPCSRPNRCRGGRGSPCSDGYAGRMCALCGDDHYPIYDTCRSCSTDGPTRRQNTILLLAFTTGCMILLAMCVVGSDRLLSHLWVSITLIQMVYLAAKSGPGTTSLFYQRVMEALGLLALDIDFIRLACFGITGLSSIVLAPFVFMITLFIPLATMLLILYRLRPGIVKANQGGEVALTLSEFYRYRLIRVSLLFVAAYYMILLSAFFGGVICEYGDSVVLHLASHPDVECFKSTEHISIAVFCLVMILLYGFLLPVINFVLIRRHRFSLYRADVLGAFGALYEMTTRQQALSAALYPIPLICLVIINISTRTQPFVGVLLGSVVASAMSLFVLIRRPFREGWVTIAVILCNATTILVYVINYLAKINPDQVEKALEIVVIGLVVVLVALLTIALVLSPRDRVTRDPVSQTEGVLHRTRSALNIYRRRPRGLYVNTFEPEQESFQLREGRHLLKPRTPTGPEVDRQESEVDVDYHFEAGELDDMLDHLDSVYEVHPARKALMASGTSVGSDTDYGASTGVQDLENGGRAGKHGPQASVDLAEGFSDTSASGSPIILPAHQDNIPLNRPETHSTKLLLASNGSLEPVNDEMARLRGNGHRPPYVIEVYNQPSAALRGLVTAPSISTPAHLSPPRNSETALQKSPVQASRASRVRQSISLSHSVHGSSPSQPRRAPIDRSFSRSKSDVAELRGRSLASGNGVDEGDDSASYTYDTDDSLRQLDRLPSLNEAWRGSAGGSTNQDSVHPHPRTTYANAEFADWSDSD